MDKKSKEIIFKSNSEFVSFNGYVNSTNSDNWVLSRDVELNLSWIENYTSVSIAIGLITLLKYLSINKSAK